MPQKLKTKLIRRVNALFTDKQYQAELDQLNFDTMAKILSDSVHFGHVAVVGMKLEEVLQRKDSAFSMNSVVRLLDSLMSSDHGIEQLDRLMRRLEGLITAPQNFDTLNLSQAVHIIRAFAYSQHINLIKHRIIEKLIRLIDGRLSEMEEGDAMILTQAYQFIDQDIPYSSRLWNKLNQTIAEQALSNPDDVSLNFVARYLARFFDLSLQRQLPKETWDKWIKMLEDKIQKQES